MCEEWKSLDFLGFPNYSVSDLGNIKGHHGILKPFTGGKLKYKIVRLRSENMVKDIAVHRLTALAFVPNPNGYPEVSHEDNDPQNNRATNLLWRTHLSNCQHTQKANQYNSKLKAEDIEWIRSNFKRRSKEFGQKALATRFGVSMATLYPHIKDL